MATLKFASHYLQTWDWRLFLFILLFLGLPNVYQLYRVYLIGNEIPDAGSLAIVSQWQFVGLVVEVFQEATVLAIFFFLGSQIRSGAAVQLDRAKSVLTFIFLASLVFSVGVFFFRDAFITLIGTSTEIQGQTRSFLGISIFSIPFTILAAAIVVLFESLGMRALVFVMAVANAHSGDEACASCHPEEVSQFRRSGMGRSMSRPDSSHPTGTYGHGVSGTVFRATFTDGVALQQIERDGVSSRYEIDYVIGSAHAAFGYVARDGDALFQSPLTYYAERTRRGMAPGWRATSIRTSRVRSRQTAFGAMPGELRPGPMR